MPYGRRFALPIDPWPRSALAERLSVGLVLALLLFLPFCAAGAGVLLLGLLVLHVHRSYDLGAGLRRGVARLMGRLAGAPPDRGAPALTGRRAPASRGAGPAAPAARR